MRYGLSGAAMVTYKDNILITGGVGKGGVLKAVERFIVFNVRHGCFFYSIYSDIRPGS